jgi:hypothetical protein
MENEENDERSEIRRRIRDNELEYDASYPGGAYFDEGSGRHYNNFGQMLRNIEEYDTSAEGYTPFGDE